MSNEEPMPKPEVNVERFVSTGRGGSGNMRIVSICHHLNGF